ncbi:amino acid-binding protein [Salinicoccus sediminis]|uniref:Amino acid-binding protein n=1 Tax=Salinicoccus sediminis TaxID=1432562 RepID=A0A0M2SFE5_9STAP|nr:transporter substrate-binding domain-containing protein [Salinicoccus sediminis]KKK33444.1 amino acid-binding protein [Salinicoccus sediminis]
MKKWTFLLSVLMLILAGCSNGDGASASGGDKVIKIGSSPDGYPTSYQQDGEMKGFNVDIYNAIFDELGYEIEWVLTDWTGVLANLDTGNVDTASNFALTPERGEKYIFTDPYYHSKAAIAAAPGNEEIQSVEDIGGKDVGTILGTNFQNVLEDQYPEHGGNIVDYENNEVVYRDVGSGKLDAYIYGREQLLAMINDKDIPLKIAGEPFGSQPVGLPFKDTKENRALIEDINEVIGQLKQDGTLTRISEDWYGEDIFTED